MKKPAGREPASKEKEGIGPTEGSRNKRFGLNKSAVVMKKDALKDKMNISRNKVSNIAFVT